MSETIIYNFYPADTLSLILFSLFSVAMVIFICIFSSIAISAKLSRSAALKFVLLFVSFLVVFALVVGSGLISRFRIPLIPMIFAVIFVLSFWTAFSEWGLAIAEKYTLAGLLGFQCFRFPLELILHSWVETRTIPQEMTWTGQNWDIVSGILALVCIPLVNKMRTAAWVVQLTCFLLLLNVIRVVILSSPVPFGWQLPNPIQLIEHLPYAFIGPVFVAPALVVHLIIFRKISR